jgi:cell division protein FtsI/penicillin-binding protein 2
MDYNIPDKTNRVLNIIILGLLLILVRVWYLSIIQHDEQVEKARRPKRRTVIEKPERATIRDRFNIPLALNKIQYNAAVCYADIRQIPAARWERNAEGKRIRVQVRSAYIKNLAELLAKELGVDAQKIEDTIHGKASLFPHTPFILKEDLSEQEYYRLKMLEKDWVGIRTEQGSKRYYPLGKIGSDVIGYMGAISSKEYYAIAQELATLKAYLEKRETGEVAVLPKGFHNPLEVRERVKALQEKAYMINDLVGKAGVEAAFDADLRGYAGKKTFEVNTKGNFLRELPGGRKDVPGQRLLLSISSELQEFAEQLLAQNEKIREARHSNGAADLSTPWIKGGAIAALDPRTGEVIALASYPRIDPNDFIPSRIPDINASKQAAIAKWLENETYIGEIWDGKRPLERERFDEETHSFYEETLELSLEKYFETILPPSSDILSAMHSMTTIGNVIFLQETMEKLLELSGQMDMRVLIEALYSEAPHRPLKSPSSLQEKRNVEQHLVQNSTETLNLKQKVEPILGHIKYNDDKLLILDLCRMLADKDRFSPELFESIESLSLSGYHLLNQSFSIVQSNLQAHAKTWFHKQDFQTWRSQNFKEFLRIKRKEEKEKKQYAKPYTDYLDQMEKQMFKAFWEEHRLTLLHALFIDMPEEISSDFPLFAYVAEALKLRKENLEIKQHAEKIKNAIATLSKEKQLKFLQSMRSFEELKTPLYGRYRSLRNTKGIQMQKHLAAAFYPLSSYGYGRSQAFRQSTPQGSVFKLVVAYQGLLERYQQLKMQQSHLRDVNPLTLIDHLKWHSTPGSNGQILGYTLDGQPITRLYKGGKLPRSHPNIGKIDIVGAVEQSSNIYFSILAAEHIKDPLDLVQAARNFGFGEKTGIELPGEIAGTLPDDVTLNRTGLYSFAIGQHSLIVTPLQTAIMLGTIVNKGKVLKPKVIQVIAGREPLREYCDPFAQALFPFKDNLASIGIHFPLFSATQSEGDNPYIWYSVPETKRNLPMPDVIRNPLIEGMHRVLTGLKGTARPNIIRALLHDPQWMRNYQNLKDNLIGKTGTAEILYKQTVDSESLAKIHNHIWFGGVVFSEEDHQTWENPELVVVVYLRFSEAGGKEAAPLATEIIKKWREILKSHGRNAYILPAG